MLGKIKNFDKKKYAVFSESKIQIYENEEKMQIKNIIEQSITENEIGYKIFIDIIDTRVAVNELKPLQKIALKLYFLTEEVEIQTNKNGKALKISNFPHILDKWNQNKKILFSDEKKDEEEMVLMLKNEINTSVENPDKLFEYITQNLLYDIFFGGYYLEKKVERKKIKENFILDLNLPIILEYEYKKEVEKINILVKLDFKNIADIKVMEIFEKLDEEYDSEKIFLEGKGVIDINTITGRLKKGELRIIGGIRGVYTNIQKVSITEL